MDLYKYTKYGALLTLPAAGFCAGFPYLVPAIAGSLPGVGLIALGLEGLKKD